MCFRRSITHAFRHTASLRPDDVRAEIPAISLESKSHTPGDADEVLGLQTANWHPVGLAHWADAIVVLRSFSAPPCSLFPATGTISNLPRSCRIGIPQVQPQRPVVPQHPPHLAEDLDQPCNVLLWRRLKTELAVYAVVTEAPIRRRRDAAMDGLVWDRAENLKRVSAEDSINYTGKGVRYLFLHVTTRFFSVRVERYATNTSLAAGSACVT